MEILKEAEIFCQYVAHEYFKNRNYGLIEEIIDERITTIGTGAHEISRNFEEFVTAMQKEEKLWDGVFIIEDEWYQATALSDNLFVVIGQIIACQDSEEQLVYSFASRVTFIIEYCEKQWKIIHVHQSVPDFSQGDDEFFPHRIIEESRAQLKKQIEQKTKELEMSNQQVIYNLKHDYLTGILNRHYLEEEITKAMEKYKYGAILVLDIDYFKDVNDNNGHPFGDQVLIKLANTMQEIFRSGYCGRIGGDEFIIYIATNNSDFEVINNMVKDFKIKWQKNIAEILESNAITLSIGVAYYPEHGKDYQELWSNGDKALYLSKNDGRNRISIYKY